MQISFWFSTHSYRSGSPLMLSCLIQRQLMPDDGKIALYFLIFVGSTTKHFPSSSSAFSPHFFSSADYCCVLFWYLFWLWLALAVPTLCGSFMYRKCMWKREGKCERSRWGEASAPSRYDDGPLIQINGSFTHIKRSARSEKGRTKRTRVRRLGLYLVKRFSSWVFIFFTRFEPPTLSFSLRFINYIS